MAARAPIHERAKRSRLIDALSLGGSPKIIAPLSPNVRAPPRFAACPRVGASARVEKNAADHASQRDRRHSPLPEEPCSLIPLRLRGLRGGLASGHRLHPIFEQKAVSWCRRLAPFQRSEPRVNRRAGEVPSFHSRSMPSLASPRCCRSDLRRSSAPNSSASR